MSSQSVARPVILLNTLQVEPSKQPELVALLKHNVESVVSTIAGWKASRLIAAADGTKVTIYSEWESAEAVNGMRTDPRMQAYFPQIKALATFDSTVGAEVFQMNK